VVDRKEALREFFRVLKPEGVVVILEFTKQNRDGLIDKVVDLYMKKILPLIGGLVSKNYRAYKYLPGFIEGVFNETKGCSLMNLERGWIQVRNIVKVSHWEYQALIVAQKAQILFLLI